MQEFQKIVRKYVGNYIDVYYEDDSAIIVDQVQSIVYPQYYLY
jgi:hypothetical protein